MGYLPLDTTLKSLLLVDSRVLYYTKLNVTDGTVHSLLKTDFLSFLNNMYILFNLY